MLRRAALTALALLLLASAVRAAAPRFWRLEGTTAFLEGELENLSLDSEARLRLGPGLRTLFDPEVPNAWCVAANDEGVLYLGTGNDGRVYRVEGEEGRIVFDADELEVYAVAVGPDGRIYAGTSPDGAVYVLGDDGSARPVFDPPEPYVWALAFDADGRLVVATGGEEGRVYRIGSDGKPETLLTSTETHVLSLAVDGDGRVFAGSSPEGIVYRIDATGNVFVLLDSDFREIKALAVDDRRRPVRRRGGRSRGLSPGRRPGTDQRRSHGVARGPGHGDRELRRGHAPGWRCGRHRPPPRPAPPSPAGRSSASAPERRSRGSGARPTTCPTPWPAPARGCWSGPATRESSTG